MGGGISPSPGQVLNTWMTPVKGSLSWPTFPGTSPACLGNEKVLGQRRCFTLSRSVQIISLCHVMTWRRNLFLSSSSSSEPGGGGRLPQPHTDKPPLITPSSPNSSCEASRDSSKTTIPFRRHVQSVALFGGNLHGPLAVDGALGLIYVAGYSYCFARWSTEREPHVSCT